VIVLLNGPFGGGKSTTAELLVKQVPDSRLFDPEEVGFMLRHLLPDHPGDFQDLPPWRSLFHTAAAEVYAFTGQTLVAPMSILRREYADEIDAGLKSHGLEVRRAVLAPERSVLEERIAGHDVAPRHPEVSEDARAFRRSKIDHFYEAYREWLRGWADVAVDNTHLTPPQVADRLLEGLPGLSVLGSASGQGATSP
jgi:hypothetical protein